MAFVDGEKVGRKCPKCGKELIYCKSFRVMFSHRSGHYTVDEYLIACEDDNCGYTEDYTDPEEMEAERQMEKAWEQLSRFEKREMVRTTRTFWCPSCKKENPKCVVCEKPFGAVEAIRCDGKRHLCNPCYWELKDAKKTLGAEGCKEKKEVLK